MLLPAGGNRLHPVKVATTLSRWALQHGHSIVSILATLAKNACADSWVCRLALGICNASLAWASLSILRVWGQV